MTRIEAYDRCLFFIAAAIFVLTLGLVYGCFNPFRPYGVEWHFENFRNPTCRAFCSGDRSCMERTCKGDPDSRDY